jgi:D-threo-aldose 1-dehydrogenase
MDPLARRELGRTGVAVTQLGFGTAPLGDLFVRLEDATAEATLNAAWNAGIRYFDTSPWYGRGQSEHRLGRSLYRRPRDEFVLSTKVGRVFKAPARQGPLHRDLWIGGLEFEHDFDYGYDGIMRSFEDSLQRLGLNRIDLLLIHDLDRGYHGTEAKVTAHLTRLAVSGWRALAALRDQGVIRGVGAGINERGMIERFVELVDLDFFLVAMPYTLLDQDVLDREFPLCTQHGIGIVIGAVFASGILATGAVPGATYNYVAADPAVVDRVRRIEAVCRRHGVPLAAAALQFPLGHPAVASVIPGALAPEHVLQNVQSFRHRIAADLWNELKAERLLREDAPVPSEPPA